MNEIHRHQVPYIHFEFKLQLKFSKYEFLSHVMLPYIDKLFHVRLQYFKSKFI